IGTTNDMPIIEPQKFEALGFLPFQINPHYYNQKLEGFNGKTRDQRLSEFLELNRHARIVALPEGSELKLENGELKFLGIDSGYVFLRDTGSGKMDKQIISESSDLQFLL